MIFKNIVKPVIGIQCKILGLICLCSLSIAYEKFRFDHIPAVVQLGFMCIVGTFALFPVVLFFYPVELKKAKLSLYPIRALISIAAILSWFEAVRSFGANQTILVNYLTPIVVVLLASLTNDEKINSLYAGLGIISYLVIFLILQVQSDMNFVMYGFSMAFFSSLLWAVYEVICKKQTHSEHFAVQGFYTFAFTALFLLPFLVFSLFSGEVISYTDMGILASFGLLRVINIILLFLAIKLATLNTLTASAYMKFPILIFLEFIFLDKIPGVNSVAASTFLIVLNFWMMHWLNGRLASKIGNCDV